MNYLSAENISKSYGEQVLFQDLTFGLSKGDKTALIARNGTGKTTLLRILGGKESSDTGEFTFRNGIKMAFLDQSPELDDSLSIQELIQTASTEVLSVIQKYQEILEMHSKEHSPDTEKMLMDATNEMDRVQGWDYDSRLKQLLHLFRIKDTRQIVGQLSGGEKKRLALSLVLLDEPEFLILDEPTNHLDIDMIEWLEKYLSTSGLTLLMVTHDRYFLDRVCNQILELDNNKLFRYQGNYDYFLEKRAERLEQRQSEADKAVQLMKTELEWLRRMPKARTHKSKSRIDAFDGLKERANLGPDPGELTLSVQTPRLGGKILELDGLTKSYNSIKILENLSYKFEKGDRIGIIGRNGTGKTSFLNIVTGLEHPDNGSVVLGETVQIGYYRQMGLEWKESQRVIDAVSEIAEYVRLKGGRTVSASKFLEHFLFPPKDQYKMISKLSGGEKRRLHLLTVLIKNPNFLILDEPTNDLDLFALNKLEEFLMNFEGNILIVSHDRYFLDKLTDHIFVFEGEGKINDHYGTYSDYRQKADGKVKKEAGEKKTNEKKEKSSRNKEDGPKKKLTYKEQLEYKNLEPEIETLEMEKHLLEEDISSGTLGFEEMNAKTTRIAELMTLIEEKTLRWMELGEYL